MQFTYALLGLSVFANLALAFIHYKNKRKTRMTYSRDALDLLSDLHSGGALVKIQVLDRDSVMMISPKDQR